MLHVNMAMNPIRYPKDSGRLCANLDFRVDAADESFRRSLDWKSALNIGIAKIDDQQRDIAECIRTLDLVAAGRERWSVLHFALSQLLDRFRVHFAVEEGLMRICGYSDTERHAAEHGLFAEQLRGLQALSLRSDVSRKGTILIQNWQREHQVARDEHFIAFMRAGIERA